MYQHPGVYIEHLPSGLLSIAAASTSVAVFVGQVKRGNVVTTATGEPVFISNAGQYNSLFGTLDGKAGGIRDDGEDPDWFGYAVNAFFSNGGTKAYIVPVGEDGLQRSATASIAEPGGINALYFTAASPGAWPNDAFVGLRRTMGDGSDALKDEYEVVIGYKPDPAKPIQAIERIGGILLDPASGRYIVPKLRDGSSLVTVERKAITGTGGGGQFKATLGAPLPVFDPPGGTDLIDVTVNGQAVNVAFDGSEGSLAGIAAKIQSKVRNGATTGGRTGFVALATKDNRLVLIPGADTAVTTPTATVAGSATAVKLGLDPTVYASKSLATVNLAALTALTVPAPAKTLEIVVGGATLKTVTFMGTITNLATVASQIEGQMQGGAAPNLNFFAQMTDGRLVLRANGTDAVSVTGGTARTALGLDDTVAAEAGRPTVVNYPQTLDPAGSAESRLTGGADFGPPTNAEYVAAYIRLRDYRDISIMLLPGQAWAGPPGDNSIIEEAITHAEFMKNRMVIVDPPNSVGANKLVAPNDVKLLGAPTSPYTALYYPWLTVTNPHYDKDVAANRPKTFDVPPSAFAAGLWARIDTARGVWKAPAGLEATVRGTIGPNVLIGNDVQDNLNDLGVNCLRAIIGPTVIWGARTLATRSQPEFRYIPVVRTEAMIGESLYLALQAVVFEPNDHKLWSSLRGSVGDFMDGLFRAGAFQGEKASEAYFVRCGLGATMTQGDIDAGLVRVVVGFAPLKPAEFVVVQIQQIVGQRG